MKKKNLYENSSSLMIYDFKNQVHIFVIVLQQNLRFDKINQAIKYIYLTLFFLRLQLMKISITICLSCIRKHLLKRLYLVGMLLDQQSTKLQPLFTNSMEEKSAIQFT